LNQKREVDMSLNALSLEDSLRDFEVIREALIDSGFDLTMDRVETEKEFVSILKNRTYDIILADFKLPGFDAFAALRLSIEICPDVPLICVSGAIGEETAIELIKQGAIDYVLKDRPNRLPYAVRRAIQEANEKKARKRAEEAVQKSEEKYRSIFENTVEGIFQSTREGRFISINPAVARMHGYQSPEEMMASVTNIEEQLYVDPNERRRYVSLLEDSGAIFNFETRSRKKDGTIILIKLNARKVMRKDSGGESIFYEGTAEDITVRKNAEEALTQSLKKLRRNLIGTIQAMALMVELRDPYTAGHEKRVSKLARAIAHELGLPSDVVDNIRMAASIHDIGKISVPAEILSKPGRLSDLEMSLIQMHSQTGYDILKDVDLPYPMAKIVLQHHERLNGSGYPQGIKIDEILLESRIVSVADIVEAMASHRPYRPALGIDAALEEIGKNKGILFDAVVVDACIRLFREKEFMLV
jgi:PAS domain S-box-containing protein/putative nucleotidyltransferase with HDIG domain